jgi:DNA polymerase phi
MFKLPSTQSKKFSIAAEPEPEPDPIDVLVDTIIGFLERSTAYMRTFGNQAFALLSGSVKDSTIDLILAVNSK